HAGPAQLHGDAHLHVAQQLDRTRGHRPGRAASGGAAGRDRVELVARHGRRCRGGDGRDEGQRRLVDLTVEERHAEARLPGPGQQRRRGDLDVVGESGGVGTEGRRGGEERRLQPGGQVSGRRRADRHVPGQGLGDGQNEAAETGESRGHRPGIGAGGGGRVAVGGASGPDAVGGQRRSGGVGGGGEGRLDGGGSGDGRAGRAHAV